MRWRAAALACIGGFIGLVDGARVHEAIGGRSWPHDNEVATLAPWPRPPTLVASAALEQSVRVRTVAADRAARADVPPFGAETFPWPPVVTASLFRELQVLNRLLPREVLAAIASFREDANATILAMELNGTTRTFRLDDAIVWIPEIWELTFAIRQGNLSADLRTWVHFEHWSDPFTFELRPVFEDGVFLTFQGRTRARCLDGDGDATMEFWKANDTLVMHLEVNPPQIGLKRHTRLLAESS